MKTMCLHREITNGVILVTRGLAEIQSVGYTVNEYHVALLLLANGFERLLKSCLCLSERVRSGAYPACGTMKSWRHDLGHLMDLVAAECAAVQYANRCQAFKDDLAMFSGSDVRSFLSILSAFGQDGRYYNFDVVGGNPNVGRYNESEWLTAQLAFLLDDQERQSWFEDLPPAGGDPLLEKVRKRTVSSIEKLARALARLLVSGVLGAEGKQTHAFVKDFLNLADHELGTRDYRRQ